PGWRPRTLAWMGRVATMALFVALLALVGPGDLRAATCDQAYLDSLPVPTLQGTSKRVVQLVNCSDQTLLGAANTAFQLNQLPKAVFPRLRPGLENDPWVMKSLQDSLANPGSNILTFDIPPEWESTKCEGDAKTCKNVLGPRFWARTGCRYEVAADRAQCETGGCGGKYDCSKNNIGASVGTTVAEWTFAEVVKNETKTITYFKDSPDISAVDGVN